MKYRVTVRKEGVADEVRVIEAATRFAVYDQVSNEGGFVASIAEEHPFALGALFKMNFSFGSGVKKIEVIHIAKNLSAMLTAGLSISRALSVIERQSGNAALKKVVTGLGDSIKGGSSFHEALANYPHVFPELFTAMARAGEESGSLSDSLLVVSLQMERSEELIRKVRGAMIYPAIVVTAIIIVGILMLMFVVPTLTRTFTALNVKLPLMTQIIVMLSDFMAANAVVVLLGIVIVIGGIIMGVRSKRGSGYVLLGALHLPVIGELIRETFAARTARTLSSLLTAGVPVLNALTITKEVVSAEPFASVIAEAEEHVRKGEPLSESFAKHSELFPILLGEMLAVGEETGKVAQMLKQIAEFYEADVGEKTKDLSTIIEPILMLLIGCVVGVFAVSMISPIYSLSSAF